MNPQISNILNLIDEYKFVFCKFYHNDNKLIDSEFAKKDAHLRLQIIDALNLLAGGSK